MRLVDPAPHRLFFALSPPENIQQKIARITRGQMASSGRQVAQQNIHLTLLFLGNVPQSRQTCIRDAARQISASCFSLSLDWISSWSRAHVAWLAPSRPPELLSDLHQRLCDIARQCGVPVEDREFKPHITLLKGLKGRFESRNVERLEWLVSDFCLLKSGPNSGQQGYQKMGNWPLVG